MTWGKLEQRRKKKCPRVRIQSHRMKPEGWQNPSLSLMFKMWSLKLWAHSGGCRDFWTSSSYPGQTGVLGWGRKQKHPAYLIPAFTYLSPDLAVSSTLLVCWSSKQVNQTESNLRFELYPFGSSLDLAADTTSVPYILFWYMPHPPTLAPAILPEGFLSDAPELTRSARTWTLSSLFFHNSTKYAKICLIIIAIMFITNILPTYLYFNWNIFKVLFKKYCLLLWLPRGRGCGVWGRMEWEAGISRCKLLYTEWINNKVLLYSTGNYIQ